MKVLNSNDIKAVNGGFFWIAVPIVIAGGYQYGKDRAERDNQRDAEKVDCSEKN